MSILNLQSGSDVRGVATGKDVKFTEEAAYKIGAGFTSWLKKRGISNIKIALGHDPRPTAQSLTGAFTKGAENGGATVLNFGLSTTPAIFMATKFCDINADAGVMFTASHLGKEWNGIKFFTKECGLSKDDVKELLTLADNVHVKDITSDNEINESDLLMSLYAKHLRNIISDNFNKTTPLEGLKIMVDSGNGSGGFFATEVLKNLGADITGSQFLDPDPEFPNHPANPENEDAIKSATSACLKSSPDIGIIFDTDVDRCAAIAGDGTLLGGEKLIALLAKTITSTNPNETIVTDSVVSGKLTEFIESLGLRHLRYKRGYRNVIDKSKQLNESGSASPLAIETSGHCAFKNNYFLDDGAYLAAMLIVLAAKQKEENSDIKALIADYPEPKDKRNYRLKITVHDYVEAGTKIQEACKNTLKTTDKYKIITPTCEGTRIEFPNGWMLIRMSLHEPLLVINAESYEESGCDELIGLITPCLEKGGADTSAL